mgnify:CR=1 FL=1
MVFFWRVFGGVLGFKWVYLSSLPHFNHQSMIICLLLVFYWGCYGLFLGFLAGNKRCRHAPLFTAPADAARHKRCLGSVSRVRRARDGRFYRSRLAPVTVYASLSPFSDERPSSRFRGIALPSKRRRLRYSTVGLTRYRTQ